MTLRYGVFPGWKAGARALLVSVQQRVIEEDCILLGQVAASIILSIAQVKDFAMESVFKRKFSFLRQSSLAPREIGPPGLSKEESQKLLSAEQLDATLQMLFYASKGKLDGVKEMLEIKKTPVDSTDFDLRTALHVAACEGQVEIVTYLLRKNANVNCEDRWGSTPLADAQHYGNIEICEILEKHGGQLAKNARNSLMRISSSLVPEYEIKHETLDFSIPQNSKKGDEYRLAMWQGTKVWVKFLPGIKSADDDLLRKFKDELALLLKLRHPNVVQFLGAVTQTSPIMIVTEFLTGGNLKAYMEERDRRLDAMKALTFALDIARGLNYLHELKPFSIVHRDLKPSNLLLGEASGHIKVANFGLSQMIREEATVEDSASGSYQGSFCRYMAPEILHNESYDKSVDVFAYGLILQEMFEGHPPFPDLKEDIQVAQAYAEGRRPPFRHAGRHYPPVVKELIEACWDSDPSKRPQIGSVIQRLQPMKDNTSWKSKLKLFLRTKS